jgi:ketosteroid isomerase-like protein
LKIRLLLILAGLAIGFAVPVHTQEPNMVDAEVPRQIEALINKHADAVNKNDKSAVAALYTQYAARIRSWESEGGLVSGPKAIEERFAAEIATGPGEYVDKLVQVYPVGDEISAVSQWSWGAGNGYCARIFLRDADSWKIRVEYVMLWYKPR